MVCSRRTVATAPQNLHRSGSRSRSMVETYHSAVSMPADRIHLRVAPINNAKRLQVRRLRVTRVAEGGMGQGFPREPDFGGLAEFSNGAAISVSRCTSASRARTHSLLVPCGPVNRPHAGHTETTCAATVCLCSTDIGQRAIGLPLKNGTICGRPVAAGGHFRSTRNIPWFGPRLAR